MHSKKIKKDQNIIYHFYLIFFFYFVSRDNVQSFTGVKFKISGRNARRYPKLSYNVNINGKGESIYGCSRFKLRALGTTDPAYIREDLAYKTLVSLGVPTTGASFARYNIYKQAF